MFRFAQHDKCKLVHEFQGVLGKAVLGTRSSKRVKVAQASGLQVGDTQPGRLSYPDASLRNNRRG